MAYEAKNNTKRKIIIIITSNDIFSEYTYLSRRSDLTWFLNSIYFVYCPVHYFLLQVFLSDQTDRRNKYCLK